MKIRLFAKFLLVAVAISANTVYAQSKNAAYWRFEDSADIGLDSAGNGHHIDVLGDVEPVSIPSSGHRGPTIIPRTGETNSGMIKIPGTNGALVLKDSRAFGGNAFTIEAIVRPFVKGTFGHIVSRWGRDQNCWRLAFNTTDSKLVLNLSGNGRDKIPFTLSVPGCEPGEYLYVGAIVKISEEKGAAVILIAKNLSKEGGLLSSSATDPQIGRLFESAAALSIGGTDTGFGSNWRGIIDEVRFSPIALNEKDLLVSPAP